MAEINTPQVNPAELYKEDVFSDQKTGNIRRLTPVTPEGEVDESRQVLYVGAAQIRSPMGTIPISFELEANSIGEAAEKFGEAAEKAIEETAQELERMRREAQSQIVVPGQPPAGMAGPGGGGIIT